MSLSHSLFNRGMDGPNQPGNIAAALGLERLCVDLVARTMNAVEQSALHLFDPNIGDQWCEARASLVLAIVENRGIANPRRLAELRADLRQQVRALERLTAMSDRAAAAPSACHHFQKELKRRPQKVLAAAGFRGIELADTEVTLALCYFLKRNYSLYRNPATLRDLALAYGQSPSRIDAIVRHARRRVNAATDCHMQNLCEKVARCPGGDLAPGTAARYRDYALLCQTPVVHDGLAKRAVFPGMKLLVADLWSRRVPILLNARMIVSPGSHVPLRLLYAPDPKRPFGFAALGRLERADTSWLTRYAFVIEAASDPKSILPTPIGGVELSEILDGMAHDGCDHGGLLARLEARLRRLGLDRLLALNTASHPQFLGDTEPAFEALGARAGEVRSEYAALRSDARRTGCCIEDMRTLRVFHMFGDVLGAVATRSRSTVWTWGK